LWSHLASVWIGIVPLTFVVIGITTIFRDRIAMRLVIAAAVMAQLAVFVAIRPKVLPSGSDGEAMLGACAMTLSILAGIGLATCQGGVTWRPIPTDTDCEPQPHFRSAALAIAIVELLVFGFWSNHGVPAATFQTALASGVNQRANLATIFHRDDSPGPIWFAPKAEWFKQRKDLRDAMADGSLDPTAMVLIDDEVSPGKLDWVERLFPTRHNGSPTAGTPRGGGPRGRPSRQSAPSSGAPEWEILEQSANHLRLRTASSINGWIVIAGAYDEGWTARDLPVGKFGRGSPSVECIVLPAFGGLRAVGVNHGGAGEFLIEYRPISFRRGLIVTSASGILLALLLACSFFRNKSAH
jgi:hypothetical protein